MEYEEYILRSKREDVKADSRLFHFLDQIKARVLAQGPRSVLVQVAENFDDVWPETLEKDWTISSEQKYKVPDTRKLIGKKPVKTTSGSKSSSSKRTTTKAKKQVKK